ncbi:MAG TPA: hypothetical protein VKV96_02610 [Roseiarcus sp.]|nr:hypothetical protein [Roseiarcus sp.]
MITCFKRTAVALLAAALAFPWVALATPASAASRTWRDHHHVHWRGGRPFGGWGCAGAGCYAYGYGPFYRGYGYNSNNWCYEGESMYDGC